ncbi:MAG: hypothetical protein CR982_09955 [Candidatus Cloacimonadota bacterium]|nr:MAG: hypothetical protein CR982_09955 [Candidatus Cloacimonadota bacterium]PIE78422.1 MAG: hypothetical protein CSA15_07880 [Candidatus Delongbacteria bacterium]
MIRKLSNLNPLERKTFFIHILYSVIEGIILGVLALNEFVFIRGLKGESFQLGLLFQFSTIVMLLGVFLNHQVENSNSKKRIIVVTALITRLPLLLLFFFPSTVEGLTPIYHYIFISIFFVYYLSNPVIYPLINLFLKSNYSHKYFSRLYSYSTSINKIVMMITTFYFGLLLDIDNFSFRYIYPTIGLLGVVSTSLLILIDRTPSVSSKKFKIEFLKPLKGMVKILKNDKPYLDFEMGFMLYGFAFLLSFPVITIYYDRVLDLNYSSVAFYKNAYNVLAIVLLPIFGKVLGKIDPRKFAIYTFGSIAFFLFFVALTEYFPYFIVIKNVKIYYLLVVSVLFHSFFAATMSLLWSIGSSYFCEKEQAGEYQSIHLSLTGLRGVFAPLFGIAIYEMIGFTGTFAIAIFFLIISILKMYISIRKYSKYGVG